MAPRNPSELQRLTEERQDLIRLIVSNKIPSSAYHDYSFLMDKGTKAIKEALLRELRKIEAQLGIEGKNYNSSEFAKELIE